MSADLLAAARLVLVASGDDLIDALAWLEDAVSTKARAERGRCIGCDRRRVLHGSICRECSDVEEETQQAHQLGQRVEAAGQAAYDQWSVRSDQWSDAELSVAAVEGFIREYIEKAYTAGFWQGAYSMKDIERQIR